MNYIGRVAQGVKDFYYELNSSTLTGAIDVIVIQQEDGSFRCSPFHVRFGKLALIKTKDLTVDILINGQPIDLHMYLGEAGEAYFLDEKELDETAGENSQSNQSSTSYDSNSKLNEIPPITVTDVDEVVKSGVDDSSSLQTAKNSQDLEKRESLSANVDHHKAAFFYSDGEITPEQTSPAVSRPPSPKSDTEAEIKHPEKSSQWSWNWGQLPERKKPEQSKSSNRNEENLATKKSSSSRLFGSMFNLIGSSESKGGSGSGSGASGPTIPSKQDEIYLDDTEKLDSEVAALYLNQKSVSPQMQRPNLSAVSTTNNQQSVTMNSTKEKKLKKTTRLSSSQIEELNLNPGANEIVYSVTTALQGTTRITSYIFLWNYDEKVIVSDIDGTITKSDVWGQVLPIFGKDWTQAGVADLYSAIENNHYKFMYLSARAIGQSRITRDLLKNVNQGGLTLPKGPLLVTPSSLFTAFQKEVIEKKPEEFKISCLQDIRSLFPSCHNPFYAGYGNKTSDVVAYKTVGIPVSRIFTINPQGELKHEVSRTFQSSYSNLCDFADLIFPPLKPSAAIIQPEYDSFNFWRVNEISDDLMAEIEEEAKKANLAASASRKVKDQSKSASKTSTITKQKSK